MRRVLFPLALGLALIAVDVSAGDVVIDGNYRFDGPRRFSYWIPGNTLGTAEDFDGAEVYQRRLQGYGVLRSVGSDSVDLVAPVHLPDAATVQQLQCFYYDNNAANRIKCINNTTMTLLRRHAFATAATTMAAVAAATCLTPAEDTVRWAIDSTIVDPVIDTLYYSYHLWVHWQTSDQSSDNLRFYGCVIDYDIDALGP